MKRYQQILGSWEANATPVVSFVRRWAAILSGLFCICIAIGSACIAYVHDDPYYGLIALAIACLVMGVGLVMNNFYARRTFAALCLVGAVVFSFGSLHPFALMDHPNPPPIREYVLWVFQWAIGLLVATWLIDPPREKK